MKCNFNVALALVSAVVLVSPILANSRTTTTLDDGKQIDRLTQGAYTGLDGAADYYWWHGCSPTSAGMMMGFYDRNGYGQQNYSGLVAGGVAESSTYGVPDWSAVSHSCIASSRHVSDFYVAGYGASGDDMSGAPTGPLDCLADFMGTSQDAYGNSNGGTTFWNYINGSPMYVANIYGLGSSYYTDSGMYGIYEYLNYCGYQQTNPLAEYGIYNQYIDAQGLTYGFTLAQYKDEIDADRPVLIHIEGHTMCGVGYDDSASDSIYVMDTWTSGPHAMTWGGAYGGSAHLGVTVVGLDGVGAEDNAAGGTCDTVYDDDGFQTGESGGSTDGLLGDHLDATIVVSDFDGGVNNWASLKFFYTNEELAAAGIVDEESLRMYWWDGSKWQFDGTGEFYESTPQGELGDYGIDLDDNYVWINVNHGSEWAVAVVPEPSTGIMLAMAVLGLTIWWWRCFANTPFSRCACTARHGRSVTPRAVQARRLNGQD